MEKILALDLNERDAVLACYTAEDDRELTHEWKKYIFNPLLNKRKGSYPTKREYGSTLTDLFRLVRLKMSGHGLTGDEKVAIAYKTWDPYYTTLIEECGKNAGLGVMTVRNLIADLYGAGYAPGKKDIMIDQWYNFLYADYLHGEGNGPMIMSF